MAGINPRPPPPPPPPKLYDLDVTIVSAKHLKNVNWRHGDLKPYAIFWVDPERRQASKSDDSGSTRPVWNERFVLPLTLPPQDSLLTLEIFHSKPSETAKPLVGTLRFHIKDLVDSNDATKLRTFEIRRPSGRPQGKIRLKLSLRERPAPDYQFTPPPSYYYSTAPPPPMTPRDYNRGYSYSSPPQHAPPPPPPPPPAAPSPPPPPPPSQSYQYGDYSSPYSHFYSSYYSQPPPPPQPSRPFFDRQSSYAAPGPSAPVDYAPYDHKRGGKMGVGTGFAVGGVAGALGGMALEEGLKPEEEKIPERFDNDLAARDDYSDYHHY